LNPPVSLASLSLIEAVSHAVQSQTSIPACDSRPEFWPGILPTFVMFVSAGMEDSSSRRSCKPGKDNPLARVRLGIIMSPPSVGNPGFSVQEASKRLCPRMLTLYWIPDDHAATAVGESRTDDRRLRPAIDPWRQCLSGVGCVRRECSPGWLRDGHHYLSSQG
jgi:hypothetical protein